MKEDRELEQYRSLMAAPTSWVDGFSVRSVLGCIFIGLVMMPASMYLGLLMGQGLSDAARWVTVVLFVELARRSYTTLSRPEIFVLFYMAGAVLASPFSSLLWTQYFVHSQAAQAAGISDHIPDWLAPSQQIIDQRTFFNRAWLGPILMIVLGQFLGRLDRFGLGYVLFRVTSDVEKLPFPFAPVGALGITALAESSTASGAKIDSWRWRVFSIGSMIGLVFGALYVGIPALSSIFFKKPIELLPLIYADYTSSNIPAATPVTLSFDLGNVLLGMVLPFYAVIGSFLGMIVTWIANPVLHHFHVLHRWTPGMNAIDTSYANSLDFYLSFGIGISLAIAAIGFYHVGASLRKRKRKPEGAVTTLDAQTRREESAWHRLLHPPAGRGDIPLWASIAIYFFSTTSYIVLCHFLVPDFPLWILLAYGFVYTPLISYVAARMEGIAGQWVEIPMLREATFIAAGSMGYQGVGIWFAPIPINNYAGTVVDFRTQELTGTKFTSLIKAELIIFPVVIISSLLFAQYFWRLAPIPSAQYPYTNKMFELNARQQALVQSSTLGGGQGGEFYQALQWKIIASGAGIGVVSYAALAFAGTPTMLIYGLIRGLGGGFVSGMFPQLLGALLARFYFEKRFGLKWREYAPVLLAGFSCGIGLISMFSLGCLLIAKSVFQLPY
jgi:hypothetical protein